MSSPGVLRKVDAVTVRVPDIDTGINFYVDVLGHRLKWRNDAIRYRAEGWRTSTLA
jgi:catechol 2,3-dioxygenase-like lactoylglutathione lyase family enzyme